MHPPFSVRLLCCLCCLLLPGYNLVLLSCGLADWKSMGMEFDGSGWFCEVEKGDVGHA